MHAIHSYMRLPKVGHTHESDTRKGGPCRPAHTYTHQHVHTTYSEQALHTHSTEPLASHAHDSLQQWTDRRHRQLITQTPSRGGDAHAPYCTIGHRRSVAHNPHLAGYKAAKKRRLAIHIDGLLYTLPTTMHSQPQTLKATTAPREPSGGRTHLLSCGNAHNIT